MGIFSVRPRILFHDDRPIIIECIIHTPSNSLSTYIPTRLHSATQVAPYRPFHTTNIIKKEIDLNNFINNTIKKN